MIEKAKKSCEKCNNINFSISGQGIITDDIYELIYSVAVFAHIDDVLVENILQNLYTHLDDQKGFIIICEQVGKSHIEGEFYKRRTIKEYKKILEKTGFTIVHCALIDFWLHRIIFERKIAKQFYKKINMNEKYDYRIIANKSFLFRIISKLFTVLSYPYVFRDIDSGWGYIFMIGKK